MVKNNCLNCSNRVGKDFCTMKEDMEKAMYEQCKGFTIAKMNPTKMFEEMSYDEILKSKQRRLMMSNADIADSNFSSEFMDFIKNGGHWSMKKERG